MVFTKLGIVGGTTALIPAFSPGRRGKRSLRLWEMHALGWRMVLSAGVLADGRENTRASRPRSDLGRGAGLRPPDPFCVRRGGD